MPATQAEKILAKASDRDEVEPGDHVICDVDVALANDISTVAAITRLEEWGIDEVWDPSKIVLAMDHVAPSQSVDDANSKIKIREFKEEHGIEHFYDVGTGIMHNVVPEKGHARPGELLVGRDSHTTTMGAFGTGATGVGGSDISTVFATGQNWFRVPETIKIEIDGEFDERVSAKDVILDIAGRLGTDIAQYKAVEFAGETVDAMSLDDRTTLTNMTIDIGGKFGFTPVDEKVLDYVDGRTSKSYAPLRADDDAEYLDTYEIDVDDMRPKVAKPHGIGNVVDVDDVEGTALDQVFIGSCTNGTYDELEAAASILDGHDVDSNTRMIVTPATKEVFSRADRSGLIQVFNDAGATITTPTCGACDGRSMGVLGDDEVCLSAQNRNYKGRMGSYSSEVYLSSPETAAASAIAGRITDPQEV